MPCSTKQRRYLQGTKQSAPANNVVRIPSSFKSFYCLTDSLFYSNSIYHYSKHACWWYITLQVNELIIHQIHDIDQSITWRVKEMQINSLMQLKSVLCRSKKWKTGEDWKITNLPYVTGVRMVVRQEGC